MEEESCRKACGQGGGGGRGRLECRPSPEGEPGVVTPSDNSEAESRDYQQEGSHCLRCTEYVGDDEKVRGCR